MKPNSNDLYQYISLEPGEKPLKEPPSVDNPVYCPNPGCKYHQGYKQHEFVKNGSVKTKKYPGVNQKFRCKECGRGFSSNTFSMDFRKRHIGLGAIIFDSISNGMTYRSLSRLVKINEHSIRRRVIDLSRQCQIQENILMKDRTIQEEVVYDGFEGFCFSQFQPCYLNTAVGKTSLYTYATTYSPLNRKGAMSEWQKKVNQELQEKHGKYPSDSVFNETEYIFEKLSQRSTEKLTIWTDEHKAYLRAAKKNAKIVHKTVSSKRRRNPSNPLFAVNHLHLTKRHFNSSHRRETISFHKHEAGLMDKIHIIRVHKNFFRSKFTKKNKFDEKAAQESPAMKIGVADKIYHFSNFFRQREQKSRANFDKKETAVFERRYEFSRQVIA
jgi:transposase-like protein